MIAFAMHLFQTTPTKEVRIYPDGEHGKRFDFCRWLGRHGFTVVSRSGTTAYGRTYADDEGRTIVIHPRSGLGDVVAQLGEIVVSAECKGGIINTRHSGQVSRLDKGLCEVVGRLMASPSQGRQVAVVPFTEPTFRLATRLAPRCAKAGIDIALVKSRGEIIDIRAE
jgi:hypothetical protein